MCYKFDHLQRTLEMKPESLSCNKTSVRSVPFFFSSEGSLLNNGFLPTKRKGIEKVAIPEKYTRKIIECQLRIPKSCG